MIERVDDLGRTLRLAGPAQRIVSLVPSITESLFAFGAGGRVVGVTDHCIHPAGGVAGRTRVGGTKNADLGVVRSLRPDLVIANAEENRKHQVEELEAAGVAVFVTFPRTVDGCMKLMRDLAALTQTEEAARPALLDLQRAVEAAARSTGKAPRVLCPIWKYPYMTVGGDTFVSSMIRTAGGANVYEEAAERYPKFTLEEASGRGPEIILLPTEPYRFQEEDKAAFERALPAAPAVRNGRIHIVEGELLSWYGPRTARGIRELSRLFHIPG